MIQDIPHYIAGQRVAGRSGRSSAVFNPALGEQSGRVPLADVAEVDAAVAAAQAAFPAWAAVTPLNRARVMFRFRQLL